MPLLLKPMTKTIRLNDIAIMIYHGGYPVLKISIREINYITFVQKLSTFREFGMMLFLGGTTNLME